MGSITLTAHTVVLVFSKTARVVESKGYVAHNVNGKSIDVAYIWNGKVTFRTYDLSKISMVRRGYFKRVQRFKPNTQRIGE